MNNFELKRKITRLKDYIENLSEYVALAENVILSNKDKTYAMERVFQLLVDEAIDINTFISFHLGNKAPETYKSSFYELSSLGILDYNLAERISESAKIRNQMTHDYEKIAKGDLVKDIKKFYELYKEYLKILIEKFIKI